MLMFISGASTSSPVPTITRLTTIRVANAAFILMTVPFCVGMWAGTQRRSAQAVSVLRFPVTGVVVATAACCMPAWCSAECKQRKRFKRRSNSSSSLIRETSDDALVPSHPALPFAANRMPMCGLTAAVAAAIFMSAPSRVASMRLAQQCSAAVWRRAVVARLRDAMMGCCVCDAW